MVSCSHGVIAMITLVAVSHRSKWYQAVVYLLYAIAFVMPLWPMGGDALVVLAAICAIVERCKRPKGVQRLPKLSRLDWLPRLVLGFMAWSLLSEINSPRPLLTLFSWVYTVGMYGIVYFLMYAYMRDPKEWRVFLRVFLAAAFFVCLFGVWQYIHVPQRLVHEWVDSTRFPLLKRRMFSTLQNPNLFGEYLLIVLAVAGTELFHLISERRRKQLAIFIPTFLFMVICMTLTYSRGIWVSFACIVIYWGIAVDRRLLFSLLIIPWILFFYHGEVAARLWSLFNSNDTSVILRWALWDSTTYMIMEHPILGIGWDAFWLVYPAYNYFIQQPGVIIYHAHNMFLNILAEIGIPGALFYFGAIYGHAAQALRLPKKQAGYMVTYGICAVMVGITISGLFDHDLFSHQVSIVFWQLLGLGGAALRQPQQNIEDNK